MNSPIGIGVIVSAFGIVVGLIITLWRENRASRAIAMEAARKESKAQMDAHNERLKVIEQQLGILTTQVSPLWARVQAQIASELHHPHAKFAEMDDLLEKLQALQISDPERIRLKQLLLERSEDMHLDITPEQRSSAKLMIGIMDKVLVEAATAGELTEVGVVGVKQAPGAGKEISKDDGK